MGLEPAANPYAPGAGTRPPLLAGRDHELADTERLIHRAGLGYVDQPRLAVGVRGVGKTVLLLAARDKARQAGAVAVHLQGRSAPGFAGALVRELDFELRRVRGAQARIEEALGVVSSLALTIGGVRISARPTSGRGDSGDLAVDLLDVFAAVTQAVGPGRAVVLTIDELQELADSDLSALLVACHRADGDRLPLVIVAAGLPGVLARAASIESFAERMFSVWRLGPLAFEDAAKAVERPALDAGGVVWDEAALALLVEASAGYPFYLQHFAASVWDVARGSPVTPADVTQGIQRAREMLADSVVGARLQRLSSRERDYVRALASLGPGPHSSGGVAEAMGLKTSEVGSARQRLIRAGLVYAPAYGQVAFTLPLFEDFVA